jgi:hypothetical protein
LGRLEEGYFTSNYTVSRVDMVSRVIRISMVSMVSRVSSIRKLSWIFA